MYVKIGLLVFSFWTPHFGWTPRLNYTVITEADDRYTQARFPSKRNRVRCFWMETGLNANAAAANRMLGRSSGNRDWLLANASACV